MVREAKEVRRGEEEVRDYVKFLWKWALCLLLLWTTGSFLVYTFLLIKNFG